MEDQKVSIKSVIKEKTRNKFKVLCAEKRITISDVLEKMIEEWVFTQENISDDDVKKEEDLKVLVEDFKALTEDLKAFIKNLASNKNPNDAECAIIAHEIGSTTEEIIALRDRSTKKINGNGIIH